MKIIVLAGGLSPERDVSLISGAGICKTLRDKGTSAYLLDVFFGYPTLPISLKRSSTCRAADLRSQTGIKTTTPDLEALKASRPTSRTVILARTWLSYAVLLT